MQNEQEANLGKVRERDYHLRDILVNLCSVDYSIARDCIDMLGGNLQKASFVINDNDIAAVKIFSDLMSKTGNVPSLDLLKSSLVGYDLTTDVQSSDVMGMSRILIRKAKNYAACDNLKVLADEVKNNGITNDIADKLSNVLKSDAVETKYVNVKETISDFYEKSVDNSGIKTGIEVIDKEIGGLKAGQCSVIGGFTGMGKSICSVSIMHSAIEQGYNVCYISLELSKEHLMFNLMSRHSLEPKFSKKIEHRDLKSKTLSEEDWKFTKEKILPDFDTLPGKFYILDEQDIEAYNYFAFDNKLQEIENLCIKETGKGIDLVIVDHVQMLAYSDQGSRLSENTVINRWCNYFRSNCLDFLKSKRQIHVILVAQINRQGYLKAVKRNGMYDMTALKEANELETCAAVILGIFSDTSLIVSNQAKVGILKNRDGNRASEAYTVPADFPHQLIGGVGSTINTVMAKATDEDVLNVMGNIDQFSSAFDNEPGSMNFEGIDFSGVGVVDFSEGMEE